MHLVTSQIRSFVQSVWTGERLVISGSSHGATAPVSSIAANRAFVNFPQVWTGTRNTALILYDGIFSPF